MPMPEGAEELRPAKFRDIAVQLRGIARGLRFDLGRAAQLNALADGFDRFADRLEQGKQHQTGGKRAE